MRRQEYLDELMREYDVVRELSRKTDSVLLLLRHRVLQRDLVVRITGREMPIADFLKSIVFRHLPEVYDVVHLEDGEVITFRFYYDPSDSEHRFRYRTEPEYEPGRRKKK